MTQTNISRVLNCCCQPCVIPQKESLVSATHQVFLPAYAACPTELGNLQTHLIPTLLNKIEELLRLLNHVQLFATPRTVAHQARPSMGLPGQDYWMTGFPRPVSPLQDVSTIIGSREQLALLLQLYDCQLEHEGTTGWESLLWVVSQLLPQLIEIVGKINVTSTACVHEFSRFFWHFCQTFGQIFTNTKEEDRKLLIGFLEDGMTLLSLSHAPLDSLKVSFVELG